MSPSYPNRVTLLFTVLLFVTAFFLVFYILRWLCIGYRLLPSHRDTTPNEDIVL